VKAGGELAWIGLADVIGSERWFDADFLMAALEAWAGRIVDGSWTSVSELRSIMPTAPTRYRLVIFESIDDPRSLRPLFCEVTGMHPTDAVQWLARAPGSWPQLLQEAEVRRLLDGLYEARVAAEAWRSDQYPELNPVRTVHRAVCLAEGLRIEGLRAEPTHWVPWDRMELICAGKIGTEDEFRNVQGPRWSSTLASGIRAFVLKKPRVAARRERATRIPRDPVGEVVVVRRDPRIAFRFVENQMSYAYLGDRLKQSAAENFPLFVTELCARSDSAYITPSTRAMLSRGNPAEFEFDSSQALVEYATHRLLWSWYRRDREAQGMLEEAGPDVGTVETGTDDTETVEPPDE
jgi:hypothetical protein